MTQLDTQYSWLRLFISLLIAVIGNVGMWAIVVVMPNFQSEMGLDRLIAVGRQSAWRLEVCEDRR